MKIKREDEELYGKKPSKLALFWANGFIWNITIWEENFRINLNKDNKRSTNINAEELLQFRGTMDRGRWQHI